MMQVILRQITRPVPREWDAFAMRCGASFLCSYGTIISRQLRSLRRAKWFEFFTGQQKIGQCAVVPQCGYYLISDRLQLLPVHEQLWMPAMRSLLSALGANKYRYGSIWNDEASREHLMQQIDGVSLPEVISYTLQRVQFSRWETWEGYRKSLSQNVLRNVAKAAPEVALSIYNGPSALRLFFAFARLRCGVSRRKDIGLMRPLLGFVARSVLLAQYITIKKVVMQNRVVAMNMLIDFGQHTYYIDAASLPNNGGAAWYLTLDSLRESYNKHPQGTFAMGADEPIHKVRNGWADLCRSRQSCRISGVPSSIITFYFSR
jgi:hypothetical protein